MAHEAPIGPGLYGRRLRVADHEVVYLRAVIEGYDGLGILYGDGTGVVQLVTTQDQAAALDAFVEAMSSEVAIERLPA